MLLMLLMMPGVTKPNLGAIPPRDRLKLSLVEGGGHLRRGIWSSSSPAGPWSDRLKAASP